MRYPVSELSGALLNAAVAKARDEPILGSYSADWGLAGPIIERESINVAFVDSDGWCAGIGEGIDMGGDVILKSRHWDAEGPTPLIAAMRAFVVRRLGDEVDL